MTFKTTFLAALVLAFAGLAAPAGAAEDAGHSQPEAHQQSWSFAGPFGTYDRNQLRRGFQVFQQVCSSCHGLDFITFRNLSEPGGPEFSEDAVRALAATYRFEDETVAGGERDGIPADFWPNPFPSEEVARSANGGALPPDLSLMAKARTITQPFPFWVFNYFTAYQEGGPDYIYNLLTRYTEAPEGIELAPGQYYNAFYPGHLIAMSPPLANGVVPYEGDETPETLEQYAADVSAFLMWTADPHQAERKATGFRVMIFLVVFAVLMWMVKQRIWRDAH